MSTPTLINPQYPGFNVLLMGPSGTGKTHAISTLPETGLETFCVFLEPGLETLIGTYADHGKKIPDNLHWHYIQPKSQGFEQLKKTSSDIATYDLAGLTKMRDTKRTLNNQMTDLYTLLSDFKDQKTNQAYGAVDSWSNGCVIVFDSLSALIRMAFDMQVGTKPVRDMSDWGIVQQVLMSFLHKITSGCICHVVIIAHVERETDLVLGGNKITVSVPGKAIAATFLQPFSDVILATRSGAEWHWDTASSQADVKTRNLPMGSKLSPDFGAIYDKWKSRALVASAGQF